MNQKTEKRQGWYLFFLLLIACLVRIYFAFFSKGLYGDLYCFGTWGDRMAQLGPANFYAPDFFCDYPPGYIWILGFVGFLAKLWNISLVEFYGFCMLKLMVIPFDLFLIFVMYTVMRRYCDFKRTLLFTICIAFHPIYFVAGVCWGQVDALLSVFVVLILYFASLKRWEFAVPLFALAVLIKPQAGLLAVIALFALVKELCFIRNKQSIKRMLAGIGLALFATLVIVLPFSESQQFPIWLIEKYSETLGSYPYASLSTGNLMFLLGGNWVEITEPVFGDLTYGTLGTIGMVVSFLFGVFVYHRAKSMAAVILSGAVTYQALYVLSAKIHERYIIPAIALLLLAYALNKDKKLLLSFLISSVAATVNIWIVLQYDYLYGEMEWIGYIIAVCHLAALALTVWSCLQESFLQNETNKEE